MPLPLSYPGLKCVLENLEAIKRVRIIGRSPGLQKIDKLIPLRLKEFSIVCEEMTINKLRIGYGFDKDKVKFEVKGKIFRRLRGESREDKMKKFVNFFFCGRTIIHVHRLSWCDRMFQNFLPADMKFRVNSLSAFSFSFYTAIPYIDPRSFPLKTLSTTIANTSTNDDHVVKSAETLILFLLNDQTVTVEDLKKLNNKTVAFERFNYSRIDIIPLIQYYIETKKATGTTFTISTGNEILINQILGNFKLAFGEFQCDLNGVNERFIPGSSKFSIPINNESRIQVYAIDVPEQRRYNIIVKPVSEVSRL
ncbi:hypothetical protein CRE_17452 [Caenorhabditis remanei]|uniref:DUF38 domain-containing protein n=1 Tax=Caenorhabditis remanei TaxID=31234 RepID=E3N240_CAERE|nr:hypothetical protein CRE_17452 [Caenorhabditis remanei]